MGQSCPLWPVFPDEAGRAPLPDPTVAQGGGQAGCADRGKRAVRAVGTMGWEKLEER
jgi:hypothetical protein